MNKQIRAYILISTSPNLNRLAYAFILGAHFAHAIYFDGLCNSLLCLFVFFL